MIDHIFTISEAKMGEEVSEFGTVVLGIFWTIAIRHTKKINTVFKSGVNENTICPKMSTNSRNNSYSK